MSFSQHNNDEDDDDSSQHSGNNLSNTFDNDEEEDNEMDDENHNVAAGDDALNEQQDALLEDLASYDYRNDIDYDPKAINTQFMSSQYARKQLGEHYRQESDSSNNFRQNHEPAHQPSPHHFLTGDFILNSSH